MTPERQRIVIAESLPQMFVIFKPIYGQFGYYRENGAGYTDIHQAWRVTEDVGQKYVSGRPYDYDRVVLHPAPTPDFLNDLNAIREAQKVLTDGQWNRYEQELRRVIGGADRDEFWIPARTIESCWWCATAAQRAEALLRTLNKWEETTP